MSAETTCRFEELDRGVLSVTLRPELNEVPWTDIEKIGSGIVGRVTSRDRPRVIVDLTELHHMGSAMVALVVRIWKAVTEKNGRMIVVNRHELVGEVLEISGLAAKWTIVQSREEALEAFGSSGRAAGSETDSSSRSGTVFLILAGILFLLAALGVADAVATGVVASSLGHNGLLWASFASAVVGLVLGILAVTRTIGGAKVTAIVVTTLSGVAAVAALFLALGGLDRLTPARPQGDPVEQAEPVDKTVPVDNPAE